MAGSVGQVLHNLWKNYAAINYLTKDRFSSLCASYILRTSPNHDNEKRNGDKNNLVKALYPDLSSMSSDSEAITIKSVYQALGVSNASKVELSVELFKRHHVTTVHTVHSVFAEEGDTEVNMTLEELSVEGSRILASLFRSILMSLNITSSELNRLIVSYVAHRNARNRMTQHVKKREKNNLSAQLTADVLTLRKFTEGICALKYPQMVISLTVYRIGYKPMKVSEKVILSAEAFSLED